MPTDKELTTAEATLEQLKLVNKNLKSWTDLKQVFARALLSGVATAIGASIIAGVVIALLARAAETLETIPFFNTIISIENTESGTNGNR